jgi:phosphate starvation-inducible membrane PsiE
MSDAGMDRGIEERYYFVTIGLIDGKAKVYSKEDIQIRYGLFLFATALLLLYVLLRDRDVEAVMYVAGILLVVLPLLYLSFASGRNEAKDYIKRHRQELDDKERDT